MNPFALPVHPIVVHFPLAMLAAGWVCLLVQHATGQDVWAQRTKLFESIGVCTLPLALVGGFVDTRGFSPLTSPRFDQPLVWHIIAGTAGTAAYVVRLWMTRRPAPAGAALGRWITTDLVLATAGLWLLILAGAVAGEMVYGA